MASFDPLGDLKGLLSIGRRGWSIGHRLGREGRAQATRSRIAAEYGEEVADAVVAAIRAGRDPGPILREAQRRREQAAVAAELLANPPPVHGSAHWAPANTLSGLLRDRSGFDTPSSVLLGTFAGDATADPVRFVHWDEDGHLLTVAPTRSGKAITTIIPNLLRYRGSAVVLDPKGELYAATSKWRAENVGPVYRLAPFDRGDTPDTARYPRHGFNPLTRVRSQADARALAEQLFPRDPRASEFFAEDAVAFVTALIRYVIAVAPPARRTLAAVRAITALPAAEFEAVLRRMAGSDPASVADAANNVLGKSADRGLPNLRDSLNAKLAMWSDDAIQDVVARHDFDFEGLKDRPATVYVDIPFDLMKPYAPWLRMVLKAALDAMLRNPARPEIPVLFVLDEFLSLGPFPEFRDAIRTHAGAGARLWFFVQDLGSLEHEYPGTGWKPFLNCSVKQFFGVDDPDTAELIGRYLGTATRATLLPTQGSNLSVQGGHGLTGEGGSLGTSWSTGESIQLSGRPLMTPDEVMELLSGWSGDGERQAIIHVRGPRPFKTTLVSYRHSATCTERVGAFIAPQGGERT